MTHEIVMIPEHTDTATVPAVQTLPQHRRRMVVALALGAIVALLDVLVQPSPPSLSTLVTGDAALAARARPLLPGALDRVSIAVVDGGLTDSEWVARVLGCPVVKAFNNIVATSVLATSLIHTLLIRRIREGASTTC